MNQQPILPVVISDIISIHSIFRTIQSEGPFSGRPATFVRLAGCNLQCALCDTIYSPSAVNLSIPKAIISIEEAAGEDDIIVITGGEPFRQRKITEVARGLGIDFGRAIQFETNGSVPIREIDFFGIHPTIVCSPKTEKIPRDNLKVISFWKYLIRAGEIDPSDGLPSRISINNSSKPPCRPPRSGFSPDQVYLVPLDEGDEEKNRENLEAAASLCLRFGYRLSIQFHKMAPAILQ